MKKRVLCAVCLLWVCLAVLTAGGAAEDFRRNLTSVWMTLTFEEQNMVNRMLLYGVPQQVLLNTYEKGDSARHILELKSQLKELGYYSADAVLDDVFDDAMAESVREFQRNNQLDQTGAIDVMTHGSILMATSTTGKGRWYTEKNIVGSDGIYDLLRSFKDRVVEHGNVVEVIPGSYFYFGRKLPAGSVINDGVITLVWDRENCVFSSKGCASMILQSLDELSSVSRYGCSDFQSSPLNVQLFEQYADAPEGMYLDMFDSAYLYERKKNATEWDVCPFILTPEKESGRAVDKTLYVYARMVEVNRDGTDQYTEMYICDQQMVDELVQALLKALPDITDTDKEQMLACLH